MNGRAAGAPIVLKGTHFEQAPALPGLPGSVTTRPFGSGGLIGKMVTEAQNAPRLLNVMKVWRNELKTSVNVINITFSLG